MPVSSQNTTNTSGPSVTRSRWGVKPTPGPGSYDLLTKAKTGKWLGAEESGASFVFKSRTLRGSLDSRDLPPPGAYELNNVTSKRVSGAQAAFKATWRSKETKGYVFEKRLFRRQDLPGPGTYERDPILRTRRIM